MVNAIGPEDPEDRQLEDLILLWEDLLEAGEDRPAAQLCAGCPQLIDALEREIAKLKRLGELLGVTDGDTTTEKVDVPGRLGEFENLAEVGRGGMGIVYRARQVSLNRDVAIKMIRSGTRASAQERARFRSEVEITAGLEHPGIVPIHGSGTDADGCPYYVMRLIRDGSLKEAIERFHADGSPRADPGRRSLELRKLLRRFLDACNAIEYAHGRGVLHRDLKPDNVIVGKHGETLVVDWGLAKVKGPDKAGSDGEEGPLSTSSGRSADTWPGSALGTLAYMSPEQARGDLEEIGPRSDVFSLGATLYCILTGKAPFTGDSRSEILRRVKEGAFASPRRVDPSIARNLEAVCLKAMSLQPGNRYSTAGALAEEIERWLAGEPVQARVESIVERAARWIRRHKSWVASVAVAAALVLIALIYAGYTREQARADRLAAKTQAYSANLNAAGVEHARRLPGWSKSARGYLREAARNRPDLVDAPARDEAAAAYGETDLVLNAIHEIPDGGDIPHNMTAVTPDGNHVILFQGRAQDRRVFHGHLINLESGLVVRRFRCRVTRPISLVPFGRGAERLRDLAISQDGQWLAIGVSDGRVAVWNLTGEDSEPIVWETGATEVRSLTFRADSSALITATDSPILRAWAMPPSDRHRPTPLSIGGDTEGLRAEQVALVDGGHGLAVRMEDGSIARFDPATLERRPQAAGNGMGGVAGCWPAPDGSYLVLATRGGPGLAILDLDRPGRRPRPLRDSVASWHDRVAISPDGLLIASAFRDGVTRLHGILVWDAADGRLIARIHVPGLDSEPLGLAFTPDGRRLIVSDWEESASGNGLSLSVGRRSWRVYRVSGRDIQRKMARSPVPISAAVAAPDGRMLATLVIGPTKDGHEASVRLHDLATGQSCSRQPAAIGRVSAPEAGGSLTFQALDEVVRLVVGTSGETIYVGNLGDPVAWSSIVLAGTSPQLAISDDGNRFRGIVAVRGGDDLFVDGPLDGGAVETVFTDALSRTLTGQPGLDAFDGRAGWSLIGARSGVCMLFREGDRAGAKPLTWSFRPDPIRSVALSPDGRHGAAGTQSGQVHLWTIPGGEALSAARFHDGPVTALTFSPDGSTLVSGSVDGKVGLWQASREGPIRMLALPTPPALVRRLAFDAGGHRLMVQVDGDHAVRVWELGDLRGKMAEIGMGW